MIKFLTKLSNRKLDLVIIETTGLADPGPVAQTFFVDDNVRMHYTLDAILTVVDAKHIIQHLDEVKPEGVENESVEQIAFADVVLLNKIDLVTEEEKNLVISKIKAFNSGCKVYETLNSQIDVDKILNLDAFSLERIVKMDPEFLSDQEHMHDQTVSSVGFTFEYDLVMSKLEDLIDFVIKELGNDLFRYKARQFIVSLSNLYREFCLLEASTKNLCFKVFTCFSAANWLKNGPLKIKELGDLFLSAVI